MKRYREHNCERQHRSFQTAAKCIWPRAVWITGDGPYAVLAWCRALTVTLWKTPEAAERAKRQTDGDACGGGCYNKHEIIQLAAGLAGQTEP